MKSKKDNQKGGEMVEKFKIPLKKLKNEELQRLVLEFKSKKEEDQLILNGIVSHYSYMITGISKKYIRHVDENLLGDCLVLLIENLRKYDTDRQVLFKTYFNNRLIGYIKDYVNYNYFYKNKMSKSEIKGFIKLKNKVNNGTATVDEVNAYQDKSIELDTIKKVEDQDMFYENLDEEISFKSLIDKIESKLTEDEFLLFKMRFMDEVDFTDIAGILNVSKQGANKKYRAILKKIKNNVKLY